VIFDSNGVFFLVDDQERDVPGRPDRMDENGLEALAEPAR
jgi:hypothetical protein